jgi:hypothetical protein
MTNEAEADPRLRLRRNLRPPRGSTADGRVGQTMRLTVDAWQQLKILAVTENRTAHDLMREAVNMLFESRGLEPKA